MSASNYIIAPANEVTTVSTSATTVVALGMIGGSGMNTIMYDSIDTSGRILYYDQPAMSNFAVNIHFKNGITVDNTANAGDLIIYTE